MSTKHESLCQTKGCPTRLKGFQGDVNDWHRPWCQDIKGHKCFGDATHQHIPKKGMGGNNPASKIVACLCAGAHDKIDNGPWGNEVLDVPEVGKVYRVHDLHGKKLLERVIEAAPAGVEAARIVAGLPEPTPTVDNQTSLPVIKEEWGPVKELPAVLYGATCLRLADNLPYEKWQELGSTLQTMGKGLPWWLGDYLQYGERRYGERYAQAVEETGMDKGRLANYAWVSGKVEPSTRVETLSWSHHREVADLEPDDQKDWLQRAQDESLTANALRKAISGEEPDTCPDSATGGHEYACKHCGKEK